MFTFPKILGFGFNPLSLYFCYNKKKELNQIIFEVKNTFGDIHHYILDNIKKNGLKQKTNKKLFVSPFFQKKGFFDLKKIFSTLNPMYPMSKNNNIMETAANWNVPISSIKLISGIINDNLHQNNCTMIYY